MTPIPFAESNKTLVPSGATYSENVTGVGSLPVWTDGEQCISCWRLSWRERFSAAIFGRVWIATLSGQTQAPIYAEAAKTYFREAAP